LNLAIDTHALKWWLEGDARLGALARAALFEPSNILIVPTLVLVELEYIGKKKGVVHFLREKFAHLEASRDVQVVAFDREALELVDTRLNIHDAIIVATALTYASRHGQATKLVTRDGEIHRSGLVEELW
jgi:PIN domain nuclease of toxin-antitoxin system